MSNWNYIGHYTKPKGHTTADALLLSNGVYNLFIVSFYEEGPLSDQLLTNSANESFLDKCRMRLYQSF
jgi:hypothetical protein